MLKAIQTTIEKFLEKTVHKDIQVVSHFDTDGITSAAIITRALQRFGKSFSLKIVKNLDEETIKGLDEGENVIQFCEGCGPIYLFKIMGFGVSQAGWFVIVNEIGSDGYYKHKKYISLSDCNIRSKNGKWESECCLLRTKSNTSRGLCRTKQKRLIKINKK